MLDVSDFMVYGHLVLLRSQGWQTRYVHGHIYSFFHPKVHPVIKPKMADASDFTKYLGPALAGGITALVIELIKRRDAKRERDENKASTAVKFEADLAMRGFDSIEGALTHALRRCESLEEDNEEIRGKYFAAMDRIGTLETKSRAQDVQITDLLSQLDRLKKT